MVEWRKYTVTIDKRGMIAQDRPVLMVGGMDVEGKERNRLRGARKLRKIGILSHEL